MLSDPGHGPVHDPLREQLLAAACRVFASKGYDGTKLMDIVRASGLSSGAVYGRFESKEELLRAAVIDAVETDTLATDYSAVPVAEMLAEASRTDQPLDDREAMQLEAFIAARREPALAAAITEARVRWRATIAEPLIERASTDGSARSAGMASSDGSAGCHHVPWSLIRWRMVSIASDLVWPIRPTGPRLIQPVAYTPFTRWLESLLSTWPSRLGITPCRLSNGTPASGEPK